jgi:hypothetical protein
MKFKFLFLIIFFLLNVACDNKNKTPISSHIERIKIDPLMNKGMLLSDVIEKIEIIPFETHQEGLITEITKIRTHNDRIYVLTGSISRMKLLCFDINGHFLFQIGKRGRGPGEYFTLRDFNINIWHQRIELYDIYNDKMIYYDFDGNYINDCEFDRKARAFVLIDSLYYGVFNDGEYEDLPYNFFISPANSFKVMHEDIPFRQDIDNMNTINPFFEFDNNILFSLCLNDTIYKITIEGAKPKYIVDFGKKIPKNVMDKGMMSIVEYTNHHDVPGFLTNLVESEQYLSISYSFNRNSYANTFYYCKSKKEGINLNNPVNDFNFLPLLPPMCTIGDDYISILDAFHVLETYNITKKNMSAGETINQLAFQELEKIALRLNESDNPVMLIYNLK